MKTYTYKLILALFLSVMLALSFGCGGGGGGGGNGNGGDNGTQGTTAIVAGKFTKEAENGGAANWGVFSSGSGLHAQFLYTAGAISASGNIASLSLKYSSALDSDVTCTGVTVSLGHTVRTDLSGTFSENYHTGEGSLVTVLSNTLVTFPSDTVGTWHAISFATPFAYNGRDNLLIDIDRPACAGGSVQESFGAGKGYVSSVSTTVSAATGSAATTLPAVRLGFAGGDDRVDYPFSINDYAPLASYAGRANRHVQMLHRADDINGSGSITGIAMISAESPATSGFPGVYELNVKLAHTSATQLTATFANNYTKEAPTTMVSNATLIVPLGVPAGALIWLPITGNFNYNGVDNLLVDIEVLSGNRATTWRRDHISYPNSRLRGAVNASTGTLEPGSYHTVFRFLGGTMGSMGGMDASAVVFGNSAGGHQFLLRASELGSSGYITKLACRLVSDNSTTTSYPDFAVTLASTVSSSLSATDADNMAGGAEVFNGTFDMPAGLRAGDWVEIPFSAPFSYNGTSNLVVSTTTGTGPLDQSCSLSGPDGTWFSGLYKTTGGGAPLDYRGNFRFWISK